MMMMIIIMIYQAIVVVSTITEASNGSLSSILGVLSPGGKVVLTETSGGGSNGNGSSSATFAKTALLLSGFVDQEVKTVEGGVVIYEAKKPEWSTGASASVSIAKPASTSTTTKTWKLAVDDEDDLVDEDSLLDDGLVVPQGAAATTGDGEGCGPKKRACKNCTCGLAEKEAGGSSSSSTGTSSTPSCGNCYKGDAFRCGGCPFLGMPAFEPGQERVVLAAKGLES